MPKQKIKSNLPSFEEKHLIGGYNFNGPGTQVANRLSLNYKGEVGTSTYWLPKNKLDYEAFKHDLFYYSPRPSDQLYADAEYVKNTGGTISQALVYAQLLGRQADSLPWTSLTKEGSKVAAMTKATARIAGTAPRKGSGSIMGYLLNPASGRMPQFVKRIASEVFGLKGTIRGSRAKHLKKAIAAATLIAGIGPIETGKAIVDKLTKTPDKKSEDLESEQKKVVSLYDTYIKSVGHFDDSGEFILKENPPEDSVEQYSKFYDSFKGYVEWSNEEFKDSTGFTAQAIPKLNDQKKSVLLYTSMATSTKDDQVEVEIGVGPSGSPSPFAGTSKPKKSKAKETKVKEVKTRPPMGSASSNIVKDIEHKLTRSYEKMLNEDDPESYRRLVEFASKDSHNLKTLSKIINKERPFTKTSPFYVTSVKSLKMHLGAIAHLSKLTKAIPADIKKESADVYNAFIIRNDPMAKKWAKVSGVEPYIKKSGKGFKKNLKKKDVLKVIEALNKRFQMLGVPAIDVSKQSKSMLNEELQKFNLEDINFYKIFPHLEASGVESKIQEGIRKEDVQRHMMTPEGVASELTGKTSEEIVRGQFAEILARESSKRIMEVSGEDIIYKPVPYFKENMTADEVKKTFQRLVADTVQQIKIQDAMQNMVSTEAFRVNTPNGRISMLRKAVKKTDTTQTMIQEAIDFLDSEGVVASIHTSITGADAKVSTASVLMEALDQIPILAPARLDELKNLIQDYDDLVIPQIQDDMSSIFKATVDKPADVRVLPKGVSIQPIDEKKEATQTHESKVETEMKKQRLLELRQEKKTASAGEMSALVTEEDKIVKELKAVTTKSKKAGSKDVKTKAQKTGSLRPHLKNPTEKAVEQAIGETPEQQARDFTNWFVFDIPVDQTGVGSSSKNPLARQNEAREKFLGEGTLFRHFNQTYELTGGVEERKSFFTQHSRLIKAGVDRGLLTKKVMSEEESFLKKFDKDNNGLFPQDQSKKELNHWHDQYQTPNDFFGGVMYPMQSTTNASIYMGDIKNNTNLFPKV